MKFAIFKSLLLLLYFEWILRFRTFEALHGVVRRESVRERTESLSHEALCHAVDLACVFYFKQVLCLQRSAAATVLLRRYGLPADMLIGVQMIPFRSHAWVEASGVPVNDKPYMREIYQVLECC